MSPEPITLHDAIMALVADITTNDDLPDGTKLRWVEMIQVVHRAHSRELLTAFDSLGDAVQEAIDGLHFTHDVDAPTPATADDEELGDDFGDDELA